MFNILNHTVSVITWFYFPRALNIASLALNKYLLFRESANKVYFLVGIKKVIHFQCCQEKFIFFAKSGSTPFLITFFCVYDFIFLHGNLWSPLDICSFSRVSRSSSLSALKETYHIILTGYVSYMVWSCLDRFGFW